MRVFHCDHCRQLIFFENTICRKCGHTLAYLPGLQVLASLDPAGSPAGQIAAAPVLWNSPIARANAKGYRLCENYVKYNVCNWAIPADEPHIYCRSCRLTRIIPDLSLPENRDKWYRLEVAKRRLVYALTEFNLPLCTKADDPSMGLEFHFVGDPASGPRVLTGHENGVITMNISEADDVERERTRVSMHEPYRTLLGHFRHEIGHYYWDRLIRDSPMLGAFREQFGNEQINYNQALQTYYRDGPKPDWQDQFVSAYASVHPWEDWAETWAHYLHMTDALETAAVCGLSLQPDRADEPAMNRPVAKRTNETSFEQLVTDWIALTYVLNNLNRGIGLSDAYPFVLSGRAIEKIRFVDDLVRGSRLIPCQSARVA
jgi:hypothetical protein